MRLRRTATLCGIGRPGRDLYCRSGAEPATTRSGTTWVVCKRAQSGQIWADNRDVVTPHSAVQIGGSERGYHGAVVALAALRTRLPLTMREEWPLQRKAVPVAPLGLPALSFKIGTWP